MRLRDVEREDAQRLVGTMLDRGYSVQAAKHVKTVISAIYTHALEEDWFTGKNPAQGVKLPEMVRATGHALAFTTSFPGSLFGPDRMAGELMVFLAFDDRHEHRRDLRAEMEASESYCEPDHHGRGTAAAVHRRRAGAILQGRIWLR